MAGNYPDWVLTHKKKGTYAIVSLSGPIHLGLCHSFPKYGDAVYVCSILSYIYDEYSLELFRHSYLSILFPNLTFPSHYTKAQLTASNGDSVCWKICWAKSLGMTFPESVPSFRTSVSCGSTTNIIFRSYQKQPSGCLKNIRLTGENPYGKNK